MKSHVLFLSMLLLSGCQRPSPVGVSASPAAAPPASALTYPYKHIPPVDIDNEIRFYKDSLKKSRNNPGVQTALAAAYVSKAQSTGDFSYYLEAEKLVEASLKAIPNDKAGTMVKASLAEARHDFKGVMKVTDLIYATDPTDESALAMRANSQMELGQVREALRIGKFIYKKVPTPASALLVARTYIACGDDDLGRQVIEWGIKYEQPQENKISARFRSLLAEMELRHGRPDEAEKLLTAALDALPDNAQTLEILARVKVRQGKLAEAEKIFLDVFARTSHPLMLREAAILKKARGQTAEAETELAQAESLLKPEVARGSYAHARDLARVLLDLKRPQEAIELLEKEEKQRADWRLYELKAITLDQLGRRPEALAALKKALSSGYKEPSLYQRAALWEPEADWGARLKAIDPSFTPEMLES